MLSFGPPPASRAAERLVNSHREALLMRLSILSVNDAPEEMLEQCPIEIDLIRELPGPDRRDYWLGKACRPIRWIVDDSEREVTHVVLAARWRGTGIEEGVEDLPVGIAFVTDDAALDEAELDLGKCRYVAIGVVADSSLAEDPDGTV